MSAIRVRTRIPENRQVTLTLPPEVPVGDAELEIVVRESIPPPEFSVATEIIRPKAFPQRPTNPFLDAEYDNFERMLLELMKQYTGKFVALREGKVVAVGNDEIDVLTTAHQQLPGKPVYVRLVTDHPLPLPRIGSPRLLPKSE